MEQKQTPKSRNSTDSLEINLCKYSKLIYDKVGKNKNEEKTVSSLSSAGETGSNI